MSKSQIVYALSNAAMPGLIKIGKTTQEDISIRMGQLYSTGVPVPFKCIYAVQVEDCSRVESALHTAFGPYRINPNREFFKIEPEQAIAVLKLLGPNDATESITRELNQNVSEAEQDSSRKLRRPSMDFYAIGLKVGDILTYVEDPAITVEVCQPRKVKYQGEIRSLTAVTKELLNLDYAVQPSPRWTVGGRLLKDIYETFYSDED